MTFRTFLLAFIVSWVFYLPLAADALAYYGVKYNVNEYDISIFYSKINESLRMIFKRKGPLFGDTLFPNLDKNLQQPVSIKNAYARRLVGAGVGLIFPIVTIMGLFRVQSPDEIIMYVFFFFSWCYLFYRCFFFGRQFEEIVKQRKTLT